MKYIVKVVASQICRIVVEADSEEEAKEIATSQDVIGLAEHSFEGYDLEADVISPIKENERLNIDDYDYDASEEDAK